MKWFIGIFAIFCSLALSKSEGGAGDINYLIEHASVAVDVYSGILDQEPWKLFKEAPQEFSSYPTDRSPVSAKLLGEIHTRLLNSRDAYDSLSQSAKEWCGFSKGLLIAYNKLFDGLTAAKSETQKTLLLRVIDDEISKMNEWQTSLTDMATNFHEAADKLTTLNNRALPDSSKTFYGTLNSKVNQAYRDASETQIKLQGEKQVLENLRGQLAESRANESISAESRQIITNSVQNLIAKCNEYSQKH
ncbi:hemolysin E, chromosomal-like [Bradysia coprophila]|uniref:hemolysin E, chromosomal-like n=1 Tax=Bradysia coprophila TaxID=38358 RepID=UPI00187DBAD7|nr:hemolysin E, chromosomal-like [Bradysia coprophila]